MDRHPCILPDPELNQWRPGPGATGETENCDRLEATGKDQEIWEVIPVVVALARKTPTEAVYMRVQPWQTASVPKGRQIETEVRSVVDVQPIDRGGSPPAGGRVK